nr:MAG TPA: INTRON-ASSOCIATED ENDONUCLEASE 1/DNA Complex-DNA COMPLEX, EXTENDED STRUCTURE, ZN-FINGER.2A [Caudoviricetes sp.]
MNDKKIFYNASYAAKELGLDHSNLSACCKGRQYSCGKGEDGTPYVWMYLKDYENTAEAIITDRLQQAMARAKRDRVVCINTGEVYLNSSIAATENNIPYARMLDHLAGKKPHAGISPITNEPLKWKRIS